MKRLQIIIIALLLAASVFGFNFVEGLFEASQGGVKVLERTPLYVLTWQHIQLSVLPTAAALVLSLFIGCTLHFIGNPELKGLMLSACAIGETFPSVAIIALSVPALGYGNLPCMLALFIYAVLPIMRNTLTGLEEVSNGVRESAKGVGMSRLQVLTKVELPLAYPIILAGLKIALIINISAATLGASVGAGGLGVTIISGIRTYDAMKVVKGTLPVLLMALLADNLLRARNTDV